MKGLFEATNMLTRVSIGPGSVESRDAARGVPWFPAVGALIGLAEGSVYAFTSQGLPPLVAASLAVSSTIWITGAFHEDGLADTADALGARSTAEAARILKDPTHGTFGMLALVVSMLLRVGGLATIGVAAAFVALPTAHSLARAGAVRLLREEPGPSSDLAASLMSAVTRPQIVGAIAGGAGIAAIAVGPLVIPAVALVLVVSRSVGSLARRRFGGVSGDVVGAAEQIGEIGVLLLAVAAIEESWIDVPWWTIF